MTDQEMILII